MGKWIVTAALAVVLALQPGRAVRAEVSELRMATQFGIGAMAMIIMQKNQLLERQLAAACQTPRSAGASFPVATR